MLTCSANAWLTGVTVTVSAALVCMLVFGGQTAFAQCDPPPPPSSPPKVEFTKGPDAIENVRGVVFDVKWSDCDGIARVEARVVDKKTLKQLAAPKFDTTDASASAISS